MASVLRAVGDEWMNSVLTFYAATFSAKGLGRRPIVVEATAPAGPGMTPLLHHCQKGEDRT
jgi:hypothetical protein